MSKKNLAASAAVAVVVAASMLAGCAAPPREPSLYQRLGGHTALTAVVDDAIGNVSTDPRINQRFANAGPDLTNNLVQLICARTGGPCTYTGRDMSSAHDGMQIRDDEFDALLEDLAKSLDKFKVPTREQRELMAVLQQMRNAIVGH